MPVSIRLRRGPKSHLPAEAELGETLLTTDTGELYFGMGPGQPIRKIGGAQVYGEDLTGNIDGVSITFSTLHPYVPGSLRVTYCGARLRRSAPAEFTETNPANKEFQLNLTRPPRVGDWMEVDYEKAVV